jgi:hypothetical protein
MTKAAIDRGAAGSLYWASPTMPAADSKRCANMLQVSASFISPANLMSLRNKDWAASLLRWICAKARHCGFEPDNVHGGPPMCDEVPRLYGKPCDGRRNKCASGQAPTFEML